MDTPDARLRFEYVAAAGMHLYCYWGDRYVARITLHADHCGIDGPGFAPSRVRSEDDAREVVRMWVRRSVTWKSEDAGFRLSPE